MSNPAYGKWSSDDTNWSKKDTEFVEDAYSEKSVPTSYNELLEEYEASM